MRSEFASRKTLVNDDYNNSQESGYSDERECSSTDEEEPGYETDISECHKVSSPEPVSEDVQEGVRLSRSVYNLFGLKLNRDSDSS